MVNVYHQTLFIQLKSLLATNKMETNTLVSAKQNLKLGKHQNSFKNRQKEKDIELPKYISNLKERGISNYRPIVKQNGP